MVARNPAHKDVPPRIGVDKLHRFMGDGLHSTFPMGQIRGCLLPVYSYRAYYNEGSLEFSDMVQVWKEC